MKRRDDVLTASFQMPLSCSHKPLHIAPTVFARSANDALGFSSFTLARLTTLKRLKPFALVDFFGPSFFGSVFFFSCFSRFFSSTMSD